MSVTQRWWAEQAWLWDGPNSDVLIEAVDGRITAVTTGVLAPDNAVRLSGLVLPGLANAHSHAFHRALRGRTQHDKGDFWTWREQMYRVASCLDPDSYLQLATAVYAEMAMAGVTAVAEFHYLHHSPDGTPYADPNAMGNALIEAAKRAGIRITLLDTLYLTAGVHGEALQGPQLRFGDGDLDTWSDRVSLLTAADHARIGSAIHSVRAVPVEALAGFTAAAPRGPIHAHLSEQVAENAACMERHGLTPTGLLHEHGLLGERLTAVHATHLTRADIGLLGSSSTGVCLCPTTERELADGIGPGRALSDAGSPLSVGTDSHAEIDMFAEARGVETHERLASQRRGNLSPSALMHAATVAGHYACGWSDAGEISVGYRADLVAVRLDSPRTAGIDPSAVVFAATAADVTDVIVDGRAVVAEGRHLHLNVGAALTKAIGALS